MTILAVVPSSYPTAHSLLPGAHAVRSLYHASNIYLAQTFTICMTSSVTYSRDARKTVCPTDFAAPRNTDHSFLNWCYNANQWLIGEVRMPSLSSASRCAGLVYGLEWEALACEAGCRSEESMV